jgi:hypothetical protein
MKIRGASRASLHQHSSNPCSSVRTFPIPPPAEFGVVLHADDVFVLFQPIGEFGFSGGGSAGVKQALHQPLDLLTRDHHVVEEQAHYLSDQSA